MGELMATIKTIAINDTLSLDLHDDAGALYVSIRRAGGGLLRVNLAELRHLVAALHDVVADLSAGVERYVEIANGDKILFVDSALAPPGLVIWRTTAGLVRVEIDEVPGLVNALSDAGGELAARAVGKFGDEQPDM
jgi:hypothetical protein